MKDSDAQKLSAEGGSRGKHGTEQAAASETDPSEHALDSGTLEVKGVAPTLYLQTRGISRDYAFLGPAPARDWWREYADFTRFEAPTFILLSDELGVRCFISGIPSRRRDRTSTKIRCTLVMEGSSDTDNSPFMALAKLWLEGYSAPSSRLQELLDSEFPEDSVEELITAQSRQSHEPSASFAEKIANVLERLAQEPLEQLAEKLGIEQDNQSQWYGSADESGAQQRFLEDVERLIQKGDNGSALYLNQAHPTDDLPSRGKRGSIALLLDRDVLKDTNFPLDAGGQPLPEKKTTDATSFSASTTKSPVPANRSVPVAMILIAILTVLLVVSLIAIITTSGGIESQGNGSLRKTAQVLQNKFLRER